MHNDFMEDHNDKLIEELRFKLKIAIKALSKIKASFTEVNPWTYVKSVESKIAEEALKNIGVDLNDKP